MLHCVWNSKLPQDLLKKFTNFDCIGNCCVISNAFFYEIKQLFNYFVLIFLCIAVWLILKVGN